MVKKIEKFDEEGKTIKYLIIGIRNRFYELYRKQGEIRIEQNCEKEIIENMVYFCKDYSDLEFYMDLRKRLSLEKSVVKRKIIELILQYGGWNYRTV